MFLEYHTELLSSTDYSSADMNMTFYIKHALDTQAEWLWKFIYVNWQLKK